MHLHLENCMEAFIRASNKSGDLAIFPNPGSETVNIMIPQELVLPGTRLVIANTVGQTLVQIATIESEMISIEATEFAPGLYFVHLVNEGKILTKKWVKIRFMQGFDEGASHQDAPFFCHPPHFDNNLLHFNPANRHLKQMLVRPPG